jgi:hypothetical protein
MHRPLHILAVASLTVAALHAQCLTVSGAPVTLVPTSSYTPDDEGLSAPLPLGFAFPLGANTYTHVSIESNGVMYLTNGTPPVGTTLFGSQDMAGVAGDSPRLAVYWADLEGVSPGWGVLMDNSVPGEAKVTWVNVNEYFYPGSFTVQAVLHASGQYDVIFPNGLSPQSYQVTVGLSAGNGLVSSSSDLSTGPISLVASLYEDFFYPAPIDISNQTTTLLPAGTGYLAVNTCTGPPPATNTSYGRGCYWLSRSFYEMFPASAFDLSGNGMTMLFTGGSYTVLPAITTFVPPPATATVLPLGDDTDTPVALSAPFPYPGGSTSTLIVCSNGFVSAGPGNFTSFSPDVFEFTNSPDACWRGAWHDFYPPGGGQVKFHQSGSIAYITWDGVFDFASPTPETFQMQFDTATGAVHVLWQSISGNGNEFLVGFAPGLCTDTGNQDLSASIPLTFSLASIDQLPLTLTASPTPVSTPSSGTVVTYTTDNMPAFVPGFYVGITIFSVGQVPAPGLDLGFLGAPGCAALVASLDVTMAIAGPSPTQSVTLPIPPGVPLGTTIYAQSAALFPPNSLPNGQNAFGLLTSNGVASFISLQ